MKVVIADDEPLARERLRALLAEHPGIEVVAEAEKAGYQTAIDAEVSNLAKAKADGAKVVDADIKSVQAVGAKVRDQYTAKNPLIADFFKQAKDL